MSPEIRLSGIPVNMDGSEDCAGIVIDCHKHFHTGISAHEEQATTEAHVHRDVSNNRLLGRLHTR